MPDKTELDGWFLAHDVQDLAGPGGFSSGNPPLIPGTEPYFDPGKPPLMPEIPLPNYANVLWDGANLFSFDPDGIDPETGELDPDSIKQINPFDLDVYYDPDRGVLMYWDGGAGAPEDESEGGFVDIEFEDLLGDQIILVFTSPPRAVTPGEESSNITVERRYLDNTLATIGPLDVFLYSTDPDMVFTFEGNPVDGVTLEDGESSFSFTFNTPNAGNPVITASDEELF